jgi:hypothetical protein
MKYKVADMLEIEQKMIELISDYFFKDIRFDIQYRKHGKLNITKVHPFVKLLSDTRRNTTKNTLPSISLALLNDDTPDRMINKSQQPIIITKSMLDDLKAQKNTINRDQVFRDLYNALEALPEGQSLHGMQSSRLFAQRIFMEIWATDDTIKDILYESIKDFFDFYGKELYALGVQNLKLSGKKDGDYNFDFGNVLFGGNIMASFDVANIVFEIDTGIQTIKGVEHTAEDIQVPQQSEE